MTAISKILLCTDGEPHSVKAEEYALTIAKKFGATIIGLYVINPFLKKFTNEIYAINRDECREYLDKSLINEGESALKSLSGRAQSLGIMISTKMRYGDPEEEILSEMRDGNYDIVLMGGKVLKTLKERFESFNLPERIFKKASFPLLIVKEK